MENMIKNKMRKIQMELENIYGKLKAMEEILSVITIDK